MLFFIGVWSILFAGESDLTVKGTIEILRDIHFDFFSQGPSEHEFAGQEERECYSAQDPHFRSETPIFGSIGCNRTERGCELQILGVPAPSTVHEGTQIDYTLELDTLIKDSTWVLTAFHKTHRLRISADLGDGAELVIRCQSGDASLFPKRMNKEEINQLLKESILVF